jgi:hypothetical protein
MREGIRRSNLADEPVKLKRYGEARVELERAIECKKPFGHVAEPWKACSILSNIEHESGNEPAIRRARDQAIQAYLSYRRAGGASQTPVGEFCTLVLQDSSAAAEQLASLQQETDLPARLRAMIPVLQAVVAGSRDVHLTEDPNLGYNDAAELLLLMESLDKAAGA